MPLPPTEVSSSDEPFQLRSLTLSVYLPTFLFATGQGAIFPIIALFATDLGATVAFAALVVGLRGIGMMVFDVPAGMLIGRFGERYSMVIATALLFVVALSTTVSSSLLLYAAMVFILGSSWSIWMLARLSYVSERAPIAQRGRALALMGGTTRAGHFAGPAIGGVVGVLLGLEYVFWMHALLGALATGLMFLVIRGAEDRGAAGHGSMHGRLASVLVDHRRVFLTAGVYSIALQVLRSTREAVVPLWGEGIGLDAAEIGIIFTVSSFFGMILFYPVGVVMDRFGRKWIAVPSLAVLALAMFFVPVVDSFMGLMFVGILLGLGNGMSTGINMTLAADFSPPGSRGEFLGVWRLVSDVGTASGPGVVAAIAAASSLGAAAVATGGIGIVGALVMLFLVPEPLRRNRQARSP